MADKTYQFLRNLQRGDDFAHAVTRMAMDNVYREMPPEIEPIEFLQRVGCEYARLMDCPDDMFAGFVGQYLDEFKRRTLQNGNAQDPFWLAFTNKTGGQ